MTLKKGQWLNDKIVEFYMEYMERTKVPTDILLLRPAMVHLLTYIPGDPKDLQGVLPQIENRKIIFIPINDGSATKANDGTHWSLLVYYKSMKSFFYYDSLNTTNIHSAKYTAKRVISLLEMDNYEFKVISSPQQEGSTDCGLMILGIMDYLILRMIPTLNNIDEDILTRIDLNNVKSPDTIRHDINALIEKLIIEKKR
ncbi:unnamed protein product [Cunninghamella blakesleeana]